MRFQYERVQKRCYECQRLTHERDVCPVLIKARQDAALARRSGKPVERPKKPPVLKESDPLFGVLREDQVGIDKLTGRPRIAADVLEGMRQYLLVSDETEKLLRINKVKKSVGEVEKDPVLRKSMLSHEPAPVVHLDLSKDKGVFFSYADEGINLRNVGKVLAQPNLREEGGTSSSSHSWNLNQAGPNAFDVDANFLALSQPFQDNSAVFKAGFFEPSLSGIKPKKAKARKRPTKNQRKANPLPASGLAASQELKKGLSHGAKEKRKAVDEGTSTAKSTKLNPLEVIPKGGLPTAQ